MLALGREFFGYRKEPHSQCFIAGSGGQPYANQDLRGITEIERLIKKLELDQEILADQSDDDEPDYLK